MDYLIELNHKQHTVLCVLISMILGTSAFYASRFMATPDETERVGYYVTLELNHYRDGVLLEKRVIEDDYILRNLVYTWLNVLSGDRMSEAISNYKIRDLTNVERTFHSNEIVFGQNRKIHLGIGDTAVLVTNYKLETEVLSQLVDDATKWVDGNEFNVTADSTIVSDGSYLITEAGLSVGISDAASSLKFILITRDVFSGIQVENADVIVIRYIFRFNVGL